MSDWLTVATDFAGEPSPSSNFTTQKSVGIVNANAHNDDIRKGSIVLSFTDYDDTNNVGTIRKFYILNEGSANFEELPRWNPDPYQTEAAGGKKDQTSMVVVGTKIYAISSSVRTGASNNNPRVWFGIYDLDLYGLGGSPGDWDTTEVAVSESSSLYYRAVDICPNSTGNIFVLAWTQDYSNDVFKVFNSYYSTSSGMSDNDYSIFSSYTGTTPKVSVLHNSGNIFWIHYSGYRGGTSYTSTLLKGDYRIPIGLFSVMANPDMPDAACALSADGDVGFLADSGSSGYVFNFYDLSEAALNGEEEVTTNSPSASFAHSLTYRDGAWHCILYDNSEIVHKRRTGDTSAEWDLVTGETPPNTETIYHCALNIHNPDGVDPDFWGMVAVDSTASGGTYPLYFYKSGDVLVPPVSTGGFWNRNPCSNGGTFDVSLYDRSFSRRGTSDTGIATERMRIIGHATLADGTVIITDGSGIYYYNDEAYDFDGTAYTLSWDSSYEPNDGARRKAVWLRVNYETTGEDPTIVVNNDGVISKPISVAKDTIRKVNLNGRRFSWHISHDSPYDIVVNGVELELLQTNDR